MKEFKLTMTMYRPLEEDEGTAVGEMSFQTREEALHFILGSMANIVALNTGLPVADCNVDPGQVHYFHDEPWQRMSKTEAGSCLRRRALECSLDFTGEQELPSFFIVVHEWDE